ncbi:MAG: cyclic nucleotide-binding domain-containing protein [Pseudomonadota bacterium]
MTLDDDIRIIASAKLFDALKPEQLRLLAFGAERLRFNAGRTIYRDGDRADCGFVIASGQINLFKSIDGEDQVIKTVEQGYILGEMALLTETQRLTGAIADTDSEVIRINRALFSRMLSEYPETAAEIHAELSNRLKDFVAEIARLHHRFNGDVF